MQARMYPGQGEHGDRRQEQWSAHHAAPLCGAAALALAAAVIVRRCTG
ncbi:hypothetical protein ACWGR4_43010 [Embleya sp. NPDC055664]